MVRIRQLPGWRATVRALVLALMVLAAPIGCSDGGGDRSGADDRSATQTSTGASGATTEKSTTEESTTVRDYTATTGPDCTVGTIPEGRPVPPGCDRLYSPYLAPGASCIEGQASDCTDPNGDGAFTFILSSGRCLVERKDPERCRDDDGDGLLDEPLPG